MAREPDSRIAARVLPTPLYGALTHVFGQGIAGCILVGGTALAGYYAGHRRSDDLDLFVKDGAALRATVLASMSLVEIGTQVEEHQRTSQFFSATCVLQGHAFTLQVVLDPNLFERGSSHVADDGVVVADLETLLKTKAATLVSRCGEKDLYDLRWLLSETPGIGVEELLVLGAEIDGGMNAEAAMTSLVGTRSRRSACTFSLTQDADEVLRDIRALKRRLMEGFEKLAADQPPPEIGELIRKLVPGS